jgi:hypothetical protein
LNEAAAQPELGPQRGVTIMPFDFSPSSGEPAFRKARPPVLDQRVAAILKDWRPMPGTDRRPVGRTTELVYRLISAVTDGRAR